MKMFRHGRRKGAITIFLTIILIPTMLFSAILIDGSRVQSAKAMTQEATDLAAISALADYNQELKDEFGMFAINNPDNLEAVYRESLDATLMAYGFDSNSEYSDTIWQILKSTVTGQKNYSGASFMNLYDFQVASADVEKLFPLSEKDVLETQMVEYAKFRGLFVITERLGLLDQLSELQAQAKENEENATVMEEKMQIDQDNAAADAAVKELQDAIKTLKTAISNIQTREVAYINALDAWMEYLYYETITTEAEPEDDLVTLAATYPGEKDKLGEAWKTLVNAAKDVQTKADRAYSLAEGAVKNLNTFSQENQDGNSTVQQLSQDAAGDAGDYQKYVDAVAKIRDDATLERLAGLSTTKMGTVLTSINSAADSDSEIRAKIKEEQSEEGNSEDSETGTGAEGSSSGEESEEDTEEEITECYYYYLDKKTYDTDADNVIYGSNPNMNYEPAVEAVYKDYIGLANASWTDIKLNNQGGSENEGKITKAFASGQSGKSGDSEKDPEGAAKRGEIAEDYYKSLPSKQPAEKGTETNTNFYNEDGDISKSKNIMSQGKHSMIQDIGETLRDDILCLSYMFGTFKTRLTGVEKFTSENKPQGEKASFYDVNWRYAHENGEVDMRFEPKKDRTTVLRSEIEYLIYGNRTDLANEAAVYATIYAERLANNMLALYMHKDVKAACHAAAAAASAATVGVVPEPVFFWIFLTAWSVAETTMDMDYLVSDGYRIPLIKTKDNLLLGDIPDGEGLIGNYGESGVFVSYEDYLLILLLIKGEEKRVRRTGDLIEMNMRANGQTDFQLSNAYTYMKAKTKMSIRYLFGDVMPFGAVYEEEGYSGRISYSNMTYQGY